MPSAPATRPRSGGQGPVSTGSADLAAYQWPDFSTDPAVCRRLGNRQDGEVVSF